jgi:hypothetical protein
MKYWYQQPIQPLSKYVRTVLIMEGFSPPDENPSALFTNGMPALLCRVKKDAANKEAIVKLSLVGRSTAADGWEIDADTTLIAYFFVPFALPAFFNIAAAK